MKISQTKLPGVFVIDPRIFKDERGLFIKTFHQKVFQDSGLETDFVESFYSVSHKDVLRGMHFQLPPHDHAKLIYVTRNEIEDVILDIRKGSPTYGEYINVSLSEENGRMIYVPRGCAHGFISRSDSTCVVYLQTSVHAPDHDTGIHYSSFGCNWGTAEPIVSKRDSGFLHLGQFSTPFIFEN